MPIYSYKCQTPGCEEEFDRVLPLARYKEEQDCPMCRQPAVKVLSPIRVVGDYAPYDCPVTGKRIEGRKAHRENLARTGCRILEPGETSAVTRNKIRREQELDQKLDYTVEKFIAELPADKKDRLMAEAEAGVTLQAERR